MLPEDARKMLFTMLDLFPRDGMHSAETEIVEAADVPSPYHELLVHCHHMTVTLEKHHQTSLGLVVEHRRRVGDDYARKIILTAGPGGKNVLAGIMRLQLGYCRSEVRERILEQKIPLGRILIEHDVLRWIEPCAYLRVRLNEELRRLFKPPREAKITYGRVARIVFPAGEVVPAVELLEVVAPEAS